MVKVFERVGKWWKKQGRRFREWKAKNTIEHWRRNDFIHVGVGLVALFLGFFLQSTVLMVFGFFVFYIGLIYYAYDETVEYLGISEEFWRAFFNLRQKEGVEDP
ncbi:MAG: hypothetical protein APZ16_04430 [Candidatus Hadarchaeum yellowstonense]|uniref:Uncharacterized protein n=1 Tax=Hadarchaeum yellowstonense TaxID=1776334 RepID=A0A147JVV8_HADYE|nr:MAG: hypothetical protein APZ16_04430 [Candidatus Hadarchaeum yellowstonense]